MFGYAWSCLQHVGSAVFVVACRSEFPGQGLTRAPCVGSLMPAFVIGGAEGERACVWCFALCSFLFCDIGVALESCFGTFSGSVLVTQQHLPECQ